MTRLELVVWLFVTFVSAQDKGPVVRVAHGSLLGSWKFSTSGRRYGSFRGIPYASPPIQEYRFKEPQPLQPWSGVYNATEYGSACIQYQALSQIVTGNEDCLFINIFTPTLDEKASLPVIVFSHGGAYLFSSSSSFDVSHFLDWDLVVVTLNYRIGPFGFISTGDDVAPGNFGLKDQAFALRWVQQNIRAFGGNPKSVTLAGQSSGAGSVHYHYLSPWSDDLFHRGIAFSGTALSSWNFDPKPAEKAKKLATLLGCSVANSKVMVDCLRRAVADDIIAAEVKMFEWKVRLFSPFKPTIEAVGSRNPFVTEHPFVATNRGVMKRLPLIVMETSHNGLYPSAALQKDITLFDELEQRWDQLATEIFVYEDTAPPMMKSTISRQIKQHYLRGEAVSEATFSELTQALTDRLYAASVGELAHLHAKHSRQHTYVGRYSFRGDYSVSSLLSGNNKNYGACNGDDVLHVFKGFNLDSNSTGDKGMEDLLNNMLWSYAATGVPKLPGNVKWVPVKPGSTSINYMDIMSPTNLEMKVSKDYGQKNFWSSLGLWENENYH